MRLNQFRHYPSLCLLLLALSIGTVGCSELSESQESASQANVPLIVIGNENSNIISGSEGITIGWEIDSSQASVFVEISSDLGETWPERIEVTNDGSYTWTPPQVDAAGYMIRIISSEGSILGQSDEITIDAQPPKLIGDATDGILNNSAENSSLVVSEDGQTKINLSEFISDVSEIEYTVVNEPAGTYSCDSSSLCTFIPNENFYGSTEVQISATDSSGHATLLTLVFSVEGVEDPPIVTDMQITGQEEIESVITLAYLDAENDLATSCQVWINSDLTTTNACLCVDGICSVGTTPTSNFSGTTELKYEVFANGQKSNTGTIQLLVANIDDAPLIMKSIATQNINQGSALNFSIDLDTIISVDESENLGFELSKSDGSNIPSWLSFDPQTLSLTGTPANSDVGSLSLKLKATDISEASLSNTITFPLNVINVNDSPSVSHDCSATIIDGANYSCNLTSTDIDVGDVTTLTLETGSCPWIQFDGNSLISSLASRPNTGDVGNCNIIVKTTDNGSPILSDTVTISVTVLAKPSVGFSLVNSTVSEDTGDHMIRLDIGTAVPQPITINYAISGTAEIVASGSIPKDHSMGATGTIVIPGNTPSFDWNFKIENDSAYENDESIVIDISDGGTAVVSGITQHTITLQSEDAVPELSIEDINSAESGSFNFTVSLNRTSEEPLSFNWQTADDTGSFVALSSADGPTNQDQDYQPVTSTLENISPGDSAKNISVTVNADTTDENDETFKVLLSTPVNSTISDTEALGTINNDDTPPSVQFSSPSQDAIEVSVSQSVQLELSEKSGKSVTVELTVTDTTTTSGVITDPQDPSQNTPTATDHNASNSQISFAIGTTSKMYSYQTVNDLVADNNETFSLNLSAPTNSTLGTNNQSDITVLDIPTVFAESTPYDYTGSSSTFTVPANIYYLKLKVWGAGGGSGGGGGAYTEAIIETTPGTDFTVWPGGKGANAPTYGGAGGGAGSAVLQNSTLLLLSGGGGGGGYGTGGAGGGPDGSNGNNSGSSVGGSGATASTGGSGGYGAGGTGEAGSSLQGGRGRRNRGCGLGGVSAGSGYASGGQGGSYCGGAGGSAGGGGGGYYGGGGGGSGNNTSTGGGTGGGGSSFIDSSVIDPVMQGGTGSTPGNDSDTDRNGKGSNAQHGRVIVRWRTL